MFKQKLTKDMELETSTAWGKGVPGRGYSSHKGPIMRMGLVYSRVHILDFILGARRTYPRVYPGD